MYGIAIDVGTSGIRAHGIELSSGKILSTAVTDCHPLPGLNAMDHLTFCLKMGLDITHDIFMRTVNKLIEGLQINLARVERIGVCGNPVQLSIFQNMRVEDLAYRGERARKMRGIVAQERNARTMSAVDLGMNISERAEVLIPPAVKREIGADALAMMIKSGFLERDGNCMITDFGTNAEMALKVDDRIYMGSAAAGPAIEGHQIRNGMLAIPGAISDLEYEFHWRSLVLGKTLFAEKGDLIDLPSGTLISEGKMHRKAKGITGTGMIGVLAATRHHTLLKKGKLMMPHKRMDLQDGLYVTERDIMDISKVVGAIRAGHFSLIEHAGIKFDELSDMYMCGASGTYVDAMKARNLGMVPPLCNNIYQIGNTSLSMAVDIVRDGEKIDMMQHLAEGVRSDNVDFSMDDVFEQIYVQELAYWEEGMSMDMYNENLEIAGIQPLPRPVGRPKVHRMVDRDIPFIGEKGLITVSDIGTDLIGRFTECARCKKCQKECPVSALKLDASGTIHVMSGRCLGTGCYKCQYKCPTGAFRYNALRPATHI